MQNPAYLDRCGIDSTTKTFVRGNGNNNVLLNISTLKKTKTKRRSGHRQKNKINKHKSNEAIAHVQDCKFLTKITLIIITTRNAIQYNNLHNINFCANFFLSRHSLQFKFSFFFSPSLHCRTSNTSLLIIAFLDNS